jgi:nucleotide-binding universal stress UspA family protein
MFQKIVIAYNGTRESERALNRAIELAKSLNAELQAIIVKSGLPAYAAFAGAADPSLQQVLQEDRVAFCQLLRQKAMALGRQNLIEVQSHIVDGHQVEAIIDFLRAQKADLLVVGLHQRDLYIARLWSTVYELAQEAPCNVLGIH